jgi:hypothetical protein
MRSKLSALLPFALGAGALSPGCSAAVGDLGGFTEDEAACRQDADRNQLRDMDFHLSAMAPHVTHYIEFLVVDVRTGGLRSRYTMEALGDPDLDVFVENFIPPGDALEVQFYADIDGDRAPDEAPTDHTWARPVCSDGVQYFSHIFEFEPVEFTPIGTGSFVVELTNVPTELRGRVVESRLIEPIDGRTVAGFRRPMAGETGELAVPGVIDVGTDYIAFVYFDADGNGAPSRDDRFCGFRERGPDDGTDLRIAIDVDAALDTPACDLNALDPSALP